MNPIDAFYKNLRPILSKVHKTLDDVILVIASKYMRQDQILKLYEMGHRNFGESKVQDALLKIENLPSDIRWHFIGHLQTNKVSKIVDCFDLIHSVDSVKLAEKMALRTSKVQNILLQVNASKEETKRGFFVEQFEKSFLQINAMPSLRVQGLMTMAPLDQSNETTRQTFSTLRRLKEKYGDDSWHLSMGMSQDYPIAIEEGADIIRIGSYFSSLI